jgi:hypothetical protein
MWLPIAAIVQTEHGCHIGRDVDRTHQGKEPSGANCRALGQAAVRRDPDALRLAGRKPGSPGQPGKFGPGSKACGQFRYILKNGTLIGRKRNYVLTGPRMRTANMICTKKHAGWPTAERHIGEHVEHYNSPVSK